MSRCAEAENACQIDLTGSNAKVAIDVITDSVLYCH